MTTVTLRTVALRVLVGLVLAVLATTAYAPSVRSPLVAAELPSVAAPPKVEAQAPVEAAAPNAVHRLNRLAEQAHVALSVLDGSSGETFDLGSDRFSTASLVKVHLVALMSWQAADRGDRLTSAQRRDAEEMLVRSDNAAALRTYFALGARPGIERGLAKAYGEPGIRIGDGGFWGHSSTTPHQVVTLLGRVLDPDAAGTYALLQDAMTRVVPEQRWGITVLADDGTAPQVKVGWVGDPDGWVVNSSGRVVVDGTPVLISVMTDRNPDLEAGIHTIEDAARLAGEVVRARRDAAEEARRTADPPAGCFVPVPPVSAC